MHIVITSVRVFYSTIDYAGNGIIIVIYGYSTRRVNDAIFACGDQRNLKWNDWGLQVLFFNESNFFQTLPVGCAVEEWVD